jgi:hypothetical protein
VLVLLCVGWIVFYVTITKNSADVLSPPLTLFALLSAAAFLLLLVLFWRHNQSNPQALVFPVGTLVPLPTLWHFNFNGMTNEGAGFLGFFGVKDRSQTSR